VSAIETYYKLVPDKCQYKLQRNYFSHRIVSIWNIQPVNAVSTESFNTFKSRLDKFWSMHGLAHGYRADLIAAGRVTGTIALSLFIA